MEKLATLVDSWCSCCCVWTQGQNMYLPIEHYVQKLCKKQRTLPNVYSYYLMEGVSVILRLWWGAVQGIKVNCDSYLGSLYRRASEHPLSVSTFAPTM